MTGRRRSALGRFLLLAGYTPQASAAVQVWAQAVAAAGSLDPAAVDAALRAGRFDSVLGPLAFDAKGGPRDRGFVRCRWHEGAYDALD